MILRLRAYQPGGGQVDAVQPEIFGIVRREARRRDDHAQVAGAQHRGPAEIHFQPALHRPGVAEAPFGHELHRHVELDGWPPRWREPSAEGDTQTLARLA